MPNDSKNVKKLFSSVSFCQIQLFYIGIEGLCKISESDKKEHPEIFVWSFYLKRSLTYNKDEFFLIRNDCGMANLWYTHYNFIDFGIKTFSQHKQSFKT